MGNFYTNFTLFGGTLEDVIPFSKARGRRAFVAKVGPDVVVYDAACDQQDVEEIESFGVALSENFPIPILACLNHDDDHLLLWIFYAGKIVGHYKSIFDAGGFAWRLSRFRGGVANLPLIFAVLAWPIFVFQMFRHQLLRGFIGLPQAAVGFGYDFISNSGLPPNIEVEELSRI